MTTVTVYFTNGRTAHYFVPEGAESSYRRVLTGHSRVGSFQFHRP